MGRIKSIIWFSPGLSQSGGGERLILEGLKYFESVGIKTYFLVFNFDKKAPFDGAYKPNLIRLTRESKGSSLNSWLKIAHWVSRILSLRKKIKEINPDVIITQGQWGNSIPLYLATLFTPFPHAVHIFGSIFSFSEELSKYALVFRKHFNEIRLSVVGYKEVVFAKPPKIGLARRLRVELNAILKYLSVRKAGRVFVLSNQNKWEVKRLYGKNAIVLKGGFPSRIFSYRSKEDIKRRLALIDKKMVLSVCRLVPKKRVSLCIKAFRKVSNKIEDVVLVVGGTGPDGNRLKGLVKELGLESKVKFVGYIADNELWDYYSCCDLFVSLDLADFDLAPLEALALGKKVVWSTEMEIDGYLKGNKFIFPADPTLDNAAKAIEKALTADLRAMESVEKMKLLHYTWDNYFGETLKELEKVVKHD